ncbi:MAG: hypothetical protein ACOYNY_21315 [Caldilineaceae bacterium]
MLKKIAYLWSCRLFTVPASRQPHDGWSQGYYTNPGDVSGHIFVTITLAAPVIYTILPVITFFIAQKNIMEGVVTTGLK